MTILNRLPNDLQPRAGLALKSWQRAHRRYLIVDLAIGNRYVINCDDLKGQRFSSTMETASSFMPDILGELVSVVGGLCGLTD
jgi:hypothetical protein